MKKILLAIIFIFTFSITAQSSEVKVEKSADGWRLLVDGKPFFVKGVCYLPAKVGESMDDATYRDWMTMDDDADGRNDPAFQSWIDSNQNNRQDSNEPEIGDFKLLEEMGCNAIRIYHHSSDRPEVKLLHHSETAKKIYNHKPNKELLRKLHKDYGIWVAMGDYLGSYAVGSGANWEEGTDYTDPKQRENMLISVAGMVQDFKDEPYILFWILGNENNYSFTHTNAEDYPLEWATLVNEAAELIHSLDPDHPVCLANGETHFLKLYNKMAPAIDILGMNSYREPDFGGMWFEVKEDFDRPVLLTE